MSRSEKKELDIIIQRKKDGIDIPLKRNVQAKNVSTYLEYVNLVHNSLPEIDFDEIDIGVNFLGREFNAPLIIDSMTGGTPEAIKINGRLGKLAEKCNIPMGLGSQRAGLKSDKLKDTYSIARKNAPNSFLIANIGGAQLASGMKFEDVVKIIDMIDANALAIHLNPLQELIQPEGEPKYRGILHRITEIAEKISLPIIIKETGAGISKEVATKIESTKISALNISGAGGTSWAAVEKIRADKQKIGNKRNLGYLFWDWGIPTAQSILEVRSVSKIPIIASGGLRNGLEIVKCIVIGANTSAMAFPFLKAANRSERDLLSFFNKIVDEIRSTMFLIGASNISDLSKSRYILTEKLAERVKN